MGALIPSLEQIHAETKAIIARNSPPKAPPDPVSWASKLLDAALDPWQINVLTSEHRDILLNCSRQVGKSAIVSLKAAYRALYYDRTVAVIAPTLRQSSIIGRRCIYWFEQSGVSFARGSDPDLDTSQGRKIGMELWLPNGGRLIALPGDRPDLSIRGDVVDDLIVDEASRVKDELITAATPSTATRPNASITYLSTPAGRRGRFYEAWSKQDWWEKISVLAVDCPRISAEFLARERKRLGPLFAQEYEAEFLDSPGALFSAADLDAIFQRDSIADGVTSEIAQREAIW